MINITTLIKLQLAELYLFFIDCICRNQRLGSVDYICSKCRKFKPRHDTLRRFIKTHETKKSTDNRVEYNFFFVFGNFGMEQFVANN